jgi:hypothetical protein
MSAAEDLMACGRLLVIGTPGGIEQALRRIPGLYRLALRKEFS